MKSSQTKEDKEESPPKWILRRPTNTFEPNYKLSEMRNIDGPWRQSVSEAKYETAQEKTEVTDPCEDSEQVSHSGQTSVKQLPISGTDDETAVPVSALSDPSPSIDTENCSGKCCVEDEADNGQVVATRENTSDRLTDSPGKDTLSDRRRDGSQLKFRPVRTKPNTQPSESEKQIKIVTGAGKKKKTKSIVPGGKKS